MNVTGKAIILKYLKDKGFDGLYTEECCCPVSNLMPCGAMRPDCEPGKACNFKPKVKTIQIGFLRSDKKELVCSQKQ